MRWYYDSNNILRLVPYSSTTRYITGLKKKKESPVEPVPIIPEINPNYENNLEKMLKRLIKKV